MKGLIKKAVSAVLFCTILAVTVLPNDVYAKAKAKTHTVTFVYGTNVVTQQVKHGKDAIVPVNTDVPGYAFSGWVGNAFNVTEDRTILGAYNKDTYLNYATADANVVISKYGLPIFQPQPTVRINNKKSAEAPSWWADLNIPKGVPGKTCAVHFYNGWNGEYWKTEIVPYGASLPDPGNPCLDGFEFVGWEGDWTNVTEDRCIKAWYFIYYTIRIVAKCPGTELDGKLLDTQRIRYNDHIRYIQPYFYGYSFDHYEGATEGIQGSGTVYAVYTN